MVDRAGQLFVAVKRINQKDAAVLVERLCDPDGERNAQRDVNNVSPNDWSHDSFLSWFVVSVKKSGLVHFKNLRAQGTILLCSDCESLVITPSASSRKSLRALSCLLKAAASVPRRLLVRERHSFKTACAGRSSRRRRSRIMMQNIFQTFFFASKNSFRSPFRTTLRTKPQLTRSRRFLWAFPRLIFSSAMTSSVLSAEGAVMRIVRICPMVRLTPQALPITPHWLTNSSRASRRAVMAWF